MNPGQRPKKISYLKHVINDNKVCAGEIPQPGVPFKEVSNNPFMIREFFDENGAYHNPRMGNSSLLQLGAREKRIVATCHVRILDSAFKPLLT
jgi:hypothetical protein